MVNSKNFNTPSFYDILKKIVSVQISSRHLVWKLSRTLKLHWLVGRRVYWTSEIIGLSHTARHLPRRSWQLIEAHHAMQCFVGVCSLFAHHLVLLGSILRLFYFPCHSRTRNTKSSDCVKRHWSSQLPPTTSKIETFTLHYVTLLDTPFYRATQCHMQWQVGPSSVLVHCVDKTNQQTVILQASISTSVSLICRHNSDNSI